MFEDYLVYTFQKISSNWLVIKMQNWFLHAKKVYECKKFSNNTFVPSKKLTILRINLGSLLCFNYNHYDYIV